MLTEDMPEDNDRLYTHINGLKIDNEPRQQFLYKMKQIIGVRLCDIIITSTMIAPHNSIATAITIANTSPEPALGPVDQKCLQN